MGVAQDWYKSYSSPMAPQPDRAHRFNLMLSMGEHEMLTEMADAHGLSAADVLRQLLRQAYREEFAAPVLAGKKSAKKRGRR